MPLFRTILVCRLFVSLFESMIYALEIGVYFFFLQIIFEIERIILLKQNDSIYHFTMVNNLPLYFGTGKYDLP